MMTKFFHFICLLLQFKDYKKFVRNSNRVRFCQDKILSNYLKKNQNTSFGKRYGFYKIDNYQQFASLIPLLEDYSEYDKFIDNLKKGEEDVLTKDRISVFHLTSGTSSFKKIIPFNRTLSREFKKSISVWLVGLKKSHPNVFKGSFYWSISAPLMRNNTIESVVPIGMENDLDYFGKWYAYFISKNLVFPKIRGNESRDEFYIKTLTAMLLDEKLSFVSVWSPSFFLLLDEYLINHSEKILLEISVSKKISTERKKIIEQKLLNEFKWCDLWLNLTCLSCWTDAQSSFFIGKVRSRLGEGVAIQGKGLMSTECVVSIPFNKVEYPLLAYQSHFYEFRNNGEIFLAHELKKGSVYEVIVTTGGGLYRYVTKDLVEVTGYYNQVPMFKFLGRRGVNSDIVGEKLSEEQVNKAIQNALNNFNLDLELIFVSPSFNPSPKYVLYYEGKDTFNEKELVFNIEKELKQNNYYDQAIRAKQLCKMEIVELKSGSRKKLLELINNQKCIKEGDIKIPSIIPTEQVIKLYNEN